MKRVTLECPLCRGMFQVDQTMAGQEVACPLCRGTMQVPPSHVLAAAAVTPPEPHVAPPPTTSWAMPPVPVELMSLACPACGGMFQVPPSVAGMHLPCPACRQLVTIPEPSAIAATAPPGIPPPPPAADRPDDLSALLPPGIAAANAVGPDITPAFNAPSIVETLLPPGAGEGAGLPGEQVALPTAPRPILVPPAGAPAGNILVPTPDGQMVSVQERPKVLGEGENEIEVRRLSAAEKARRKMVRNAILFVMGVVALLVIVVVMSRR